MPKIKFNRAVDSDDLPYSRSSIKPARKSDSFESDKISQKKKETSRRRQREQQKQYSESSW